MKVFLSALAVVFACVACTSEPAETQVRASEPSPTVTEASSPNGRCAFPAMRPTYLPWLSKRDAIPRPERSYDREIDRAQLSWSNPKDPSDGIGLTVYAEPTGTPGKRLGVKVGGVTGYLHHGPGRETGAWWDLDARCNFLELSISLSAAGRVRLERELVRVAKSLSKPRVSPTCVRDDYCLSSSAAEAGARVVASAPAGGPNKGGRYVATERIEIWWGLPSSAWTEVLDERTHSTGQLVAEGSEPSQGQFRMAFEVPSGTDVGVYPVTEIVYGGGGATNVAFRFEVTD